MKKQSVSSSKTSQTSTQTPKTQAPLPRKIAKAPAVKRARTTDGTSIPEEAKIPDSSSTPPTPNIEEKEPETTKEENNGHKGKKVLDILNACHKTKYLPLADGMFTSNVYFHPIEIVESKKNWVDVKMKEFFIGGDMYMCESLHVYSMEADDLLRMIYLGEMVNCDNIDVKRISFEQWVLDIFSKMIEEDSHSDYTDRGRIAIYAFSHCDALRLSPGHRIQFFFQKRCVYDFLEPTSDFEHIGSNAMCVRTKSMRGKFEYLIELHIICIPAICDSEADDMEDVKMKREIEEGVPPST